MPAKENSKYIDLVIRVCLEFSRTNKKPTVFGVHPVGERIVENMVREVRETRLHGIVLRTLTFTHSEKENL